MRSFRVAIGKKWWLICFVKMTELGLCFPDHKIILLHDKLKSKELKEIAIHEMLHALNWSKSEKAVKKASAAIINILEAL